MAVDSLPQVTIYTDGGCNPNPGPGGWAAILLYPDRPAQELSGANPHTTNNQMELQAATEALKALPGPHRIEFYTDSTYVRQGITEWLPGWERRNWQRGSAEIKNQEFWQQLATQVKGHQITWHWVKGHAGNKWNERADTLASAMIPRPDLPLADQNAVHIFTAGAYSGKTGVGGWAVILKYRGTEKSLSGCAHNTSGNRMHLQSALEGLLAIKKPVPIHLYTASDYLKDGATLWLKSWRARGWQTKDGKAVSHRDLWEKLDDLAGQYSPQWHVVSKEAMPAEMKRAKLLAGQAAEKK